MIDSTLNQNLEERGPSLRICPWPAAVGNQRRSYIVPRQTFFPVTLGSSSLSIIGRIVLLPERVTPIYRRTRGFFKSWAFSSGADRLSVERFEKILTQRRIDIYLHY